MWRIATIASTQSGVLRFKGPDVGFLLLHPCSNTGALEIQGGVGDDKHTLRPRYCWVTACASYVWNSEYSNKSTGKVQLVM